MRSALLCLLLWPLAGWSAPALQKINVIPPAPGVVAPLKTYREWKNEKVLRASQQVLQSSRDLQLLRTRTSPTPAVRNAIANLEQQRAQEQWNLEVAQDLSFTDYLALYLAQQPPARFAEVARKMSPQETAQLMSAYLRAIGAAPSTESLKLPLNAYQSR